MPSCTASAPRLSRRTWHKKNGYEGSGIVCPHCQQGAKFHGYRSKTTCSLIGTVACTRAYYYCGRCGKGMLPWDDRVGLTARSFTPAAERLVSLAGTLSDSFAEAADRVLPEMAGLQVAETTVQRATEGWANASLPTGAAAAPLVFSGRGLGFRTFRAGPVPTSAWI